ncbi:MAG: hypothetical protein JWL68_6619 [Actinomycetia bacterium]|nr:hypothetical protein [Actinomycetes bacterium]
MTIINGKPRLLDDIRLQPTAGRPGGALHALTADAAAATGTGSWAAVPVGAPVPSGYDGEGNRDG